ncbi:MAG: hypothetical protein IJB39_04130 [Alistipes sp.]|nr:hypothetical protein [Alistipes sp.]
MAEEFSVFTYNIITLLMKWGYNELQTQQQKDYPKHRGEWKNTLGNQLVTRITLGLGLKDFLLTTL